MSFCCVSLWKLFRSTKIRSDLLETLNEYIERVTFLPNEDFIYVQTEGINVQVTTMDLFITKSNFIEINKLLLDRVAVFTQRN